MTRFLQSFDLRRSPYERPNHTWVCGRTDAPCKVGPDARGRCRATAECRPRFDGSRWVCTRSRDAGGDCADGPRPDGSCACPIPPCQPVRSVRAKRGLVTRWATVAALGLAVVLLAGGDREAALSPGPLTPEHADVAGCAGCHEAGDAGPSGITRAALDGVAPAHAGDSQACLTCHQVGDAPFAPHSAQSLPAAPAGDDPDAPQLSPPYILNFASRSFPRSGGTGEDTACATCHREHQGTAADITAISDGRCQACHTRKFTGFNAGHPEFDAYPYDRRTRLDFDHVAHAKKYFAEADAAGPQTCTACHTPAPQSGLIATKGFAEGCAACHAGEIRGQGIAGTRGVPVIGVPGLDVLTLKERGIAIGQWPDLADSDLTPFTRTILAGRKGVRADTLARFAELDTMDLRGASADDLRVVKRTAWAFKRLIYDLTAQGPQAAATALQARLRRSLPEGAVRDMLGGLPQDTVRAARREWFPDLATELARRDAGQEVPIPGGAQEAPDDTADSEDASAYTAGGDGDLLGAGGDAEQGDDGGLLGDDGSSAADGEGGGLLGGGEETSPDSADAGGDGLLGGDDTDGGLAGDSDSGGGDLLGGDGGDGDDAGLMSRDGTEEAADQAKPEIEAEMPEPLPSEWTALGGWYRDFYVLSYRPRDHGDAFLRRWLETTARYGGRDGAIAEVFAQLSDPKAPGRCVKCHSVDRRAAGGFQVNWQAGTPVASDGRLTGFRHGPHLTLTSGRDGCATCHKFVQEAAYAASFDDRDPATFASNFAAIDKATCARCHTPEKAGSACTQCHSYHAERPHSQAVKTEMSAGEVGQ